MLQNQKHFYQPTLRSKYFSTPLLVLPLLLGCHSCSAFVTMRPYNTHSQNRKVASTVLNMAQKETVAVIGGGIAGLSCATALSSSGKFDPTVFDTGRLRPGGRCSSRLPGDMPKDPSDKHRILDTSVIDHAAQIITVPKQLKGFEEFQNQVDAWEAQGILRQFPEGSVCDIVTNKKDGQEAFRLKPLKSSGNMYYGAKGMGSIPTSMASGKAFPVEQDVWVSPNNGVRYERDGKWKVKANGKNLGAFDRLVIAHNGKCADRLMSKTPARDLHSLLRTNFSPSVPAWGGKRMTLNSIYSLTIAVDKKSSPIAKSLNNDKFMSGFVKNEPTLRFLTCQTRKHPNEKDDVEIWTVLSSAKFGKKYKGPQENLPDELVTEVTGLLLSAIERSLCMEPGSLRGPEDADPGANVVLDSRLQLWGAAVPLNTWSTATGENKEDANAGFIYDGEFGVGACGDWLLDSSIAGAWESGRRLADWMCDKSETSVGLPPNGAFQSSKAVSQQGIGSLK
mmetsp:Transcript_23076/g.32310  ORF Transcript_23076/g.32310 Transcript_23076/m.32310 type:complete len:506 (-) Transcript_23076:1305-2822(-)